MILQWKPELGDVAKKYLNLDASLNVIGLTDDDSYTRIPGNTTTPKISFPATLDNGEAPDAALPDETSIQTEFKAENTAGSDEMVSNVVTPSPSCVSGPIETDVIMRFHASSDKLMIRERPTGAKMGWSSSKRTWAATVSKLLIFLLFYVNTECRRWCSANG